jgi:hypothetical protein
MGGNAVHLDQGERGSGVYRMPTMTRRRRSRRRGNCLWERLMAAPPPPAYPARCLGSKQLFASEASAQVFLEFICLQLDSQNTIIITMGKAQKKKSMRRHNPVRVPDSHMPKGLDSASASSSKKEAVLPIIQKVGVSACSHA